MSGFWNRLVYFKAYVKHDYIVIKVDKETQF